MAAWCIGWPICRCGTTSRRPFDAVETGPRAAQWRADAPSTLVWAEAQDGGDPRGSTRAARPARWSTHPILKAPETYNAMSPFAYADKVNEPILLIHGEADDNSGTFPVQTERFYAALKGNGATVRYVVLPLEAHGYRARESVGHTLWEMTRWLDQTIKSPTATASR